MLADYLRRADEELEQLAAGGDGDAFAALYERHFDRVYDFTFSLVRDPDEAADIAQDTFLRAMKALSPGEKPASVSTWLFTIARNLSLTRLSRGKRTIPIATPEDADDEPAPLQSRYLVDESKFSDPETAARATDLAGLVWEAVAFLNPKESSILDLHLRQGLESAEIAQVLGITKGNAYTILSRLKDSVEQSVTTLVLVRNARSKCGELDHLLSAQDSSLLSPEVRRIVMRHLSGCEICNEERKKLLSPASLFGAFAMVPAPLALKAHGAEGMHQQWAAHGPGARSGAEGLAQSGETSHRSLIQQVQSIPRRGLRTVTRAASGIARPIRGLLMTWPYLTLRRRAVTMGVFLALLLALFGLGVVVDESTAARRGGNGTAVLSDRRAPTVDRGPATPTRSPLVSTSPTEAPTMSPQPPTSVVTPASTLRPGPQPTPAPVPTPIVVLPPSPCVPESASPSSTVTEEPAFASEFEALTNNYRAGLGLPPLTPHSSLLTAARQHSQFVSLTRWWLNHSGGYSIHCDSAGHDHYNRAVDAGYPPSYIGENVVWGTSGRTPQQAFSDVIGSPSHEDPGSPVFHAVGTACFRRTDNGEYACVQVLAE